MTWYEQQCENKFLPGALISTKERNSFSLKYFLIVSVSNEVFDNSSTQGAKQF